MFPRWARIVGGVSHGVGSSPLPPKRLDGATEAIGELSLYIGELSLYINNNNIKNNIAVLARIGPLCGFRLAKRKTKKYIYICMYLCMYVYVYICYIYIYKSFFIIKKGPLSPIF